MDTQAHPKGAPAAGSGAQERLLQAGMDIFGKHGYDGATTRMIARQAGTNIAAIPYYFNGKEGLYKAVVSHIVDLIAAQLEDTRREIANRSFNGLEAKEEAIELLEKLVTRFIRFMVGSPEAPRISRIILREQMYPTAAYDIIFSGFMGNVLEASARLIMVITGDRSQRVAKLRAMAIVGQVLAFRVARETIVRALDLEGYSDSETAEIHGIIMEHTRYITAGLGRDPSQPLEEQQ
jgi:TetR/AcrR family transcriptional regulator, regulator of cefoperazone and chloramphenicol sensitivity